MKREKAPVDFVRTLIAFTYSLHLIVHFVHSLFVVI